MNHTDEPLQMIVNHSEAILSEHFTQQETGLLLMYIDAYEVGRINLPSREQVEANIPNSNGWATPLENSNYASSQYLHTLIARHRVTRKSEDAERARCLFKALIRLRETSTSDTFVPRGLLSDGRTHYVDASIDQISFWIMAMWNYYRSDIATVEERKTIRRYLLAMAAGAERNNWTFRREDGRMTFWCDLRSEKLPRARLIHLMLLSVAFDVSEDQHWRELYERFRDEDNSALFSRAATEYTWVSSQTAWVLETLVRLETQVRDSEQYRSTLRQIAEASVRQMRKYVDYEPERAWRDFQFRSDTYRDVMFGSIGLALCPDAEYVSANLHLADSALRHYPYRRDGKIVDLIDAIPRYYWLLVQRGLLPYLPSLDVPGDPTIEGIPADRPYPLNYGHWFDSHARTYEGHAPDEKRPETQFFYVP